jgi:hypothetical protein
MKIIILFLSVLFANLTYGQNNSSYLLRWKIRDTTYYNVTYNEAYAEGDDISLDIQDPKAQTEIAKLKTKLRLKPFPNKETSKIYPSRSNFYAQFYLGSFAVGRGLIDSSGNLLSNVDKGSENFYKMFYDLPDWPVHIGEKWKTEIQIQKKFKGIKVIDSVKINQATLVNIERNGKDLVGSVKFEISEKYTCSYTDKTGKEKTGFFLIFYNALGRFDITNGKWKNIDGIVIFDIHMTSSKRTLVKVGLSPIHDLSE